MEKYGGIVSAARLIALWVALSPAAASAQSVFRLDVADGGDKAQSGFATLVSDNTLLTSFGLVNQGDRWMVTNISNNAALTAVLLDRDEVNDLALLQADGISGEPMTVAMKGAQKNRVVELRIPGTPRQGVVLDIYGTPARVRHTATLKNNEFAAPLVNNCGELLGVSQSPKAGLLGDRLQAGGFGLAGGLVALQSLLGKNNVPYRLANRVCPPESQRLAQMEEIVKQREVDLFRRQDEINRARRQAGQDSQRQAALSQRQAELDSERRSQERTKMEIEDKKRQMREVKRSAETQEKAMLEAAALQDAKTKRQWYFIAAAAAAAALVLLFVIVFMMRKRVRQQRQRHVVGEGTTIKPKNKDTAAARHGQFPDILLVGTDASGNEHQLKINGDALINSPQGQVIGRSARDSDYTLNLKYVSRRHCLLQARDGQVYVKDLNSANGTAVNGVNLTPQKEEDDNSQSEVTKTVTATPRFREAIIKDGYKLRIGLLIMRVSMQG